MKQINIDIIIIIYKDTQIFLYKFVFRFLDHIIFLNHDDPKDLIEDLRKSLKHLKWVQKNSLRIIPL